MRLVSLSRRSVGTEEGEEEDEEEERHECDSLRSTNRRVNLKILRMVTIEFENEVEIIAAPLALAPVIAT